MTLAVLVNPIAGRGRAVRAADIAVARFRDAGADVAVRTGASIDEMRILATQAVATRPDAVVVVGGDGTLAAILDEVLDARIPVGLIPAGTGNDLARTLGVPRDPVRAAEIVLRGSPRVIDVGEAESGGRVARFLTVAALGFDASVAARTNRMRYPRGSLRYVLAIAIEFVHLRTFDFTIAIDGRPAEHLPGLLIAIANTGSYGGGIRIAPEADHADGRFDIVRAGPIRRGRLLRLLPKLLRGRHLGLPDVAFVRAERLEVSGEGIIAIADGEVVGSGRIAFRVMRERLSVLAPDTS